MVSKEPNRMPTIHNQNNGNPEKVPAAVTVRSVLLNRNSPDIESRLKRRRNRTQQVRFKDLDDGDGPEKDGLKSSQKSPKEVPNWREELANGPSVVGAVRGDMEGTIGAVTAFLKRAPPHPLTPGPTRRCWVPNWPSSHTLPLPNQSCRSTAIQTSPSLQKPPYVSTRHTRSHSLGDGGKKGWLDEDSPDEAISQECCKPCRSQVSPATKSTPVEQSPCLSTSTKGDQPASSATTTRLCSCSPHPSKVGRRRGRRRTLSRAVSDPGRPESPCALPTGTASTGNHRMESETVPAKASVSQAVPSCTPTPQASSRVEVSSLGSDGTLQTGALPPSNDSPTTVLSTCSSQPVLSYTSSQQNAQSYKSSSQTRSHVTSSTEDASSHPKTPQTLETCPAEPQCKPSNSPQSQVASPSIPVAHTEPASVISPEASSSCVTSSQTIPCSSQVMSNGPSATTPPQTVQSCKTSSKIVAGCPPPVPPMPRSKAPTEPVACCLPDATGTSYITLKQPALPNQPVPCCKTSKQTESDSSSGTPNVPYCVPDTPAVVPCISSTQPHSSCKTSPQPVIPSTAPTQPVTPIEALTQPVTPSKVPIQPVTPSKVPTQPVTPTEPVTPSKAPTQPVTPSKAPTQPETLCKTPLQPETPFKTPIQAVKPCKMTTQPMIPLNIPSQTVPCHKPTSLPVSCPKTSTQPVPHVVSNAEIAALPVPPVQPATVCQFVPCCETPTQNVPYVAHETATVASHAYLTQPMTTCKASATPPMSRYKAPNQAVEHCIPDAQTMASLGSSVQPVQLYGPAAQPASSSNAQNTYCVLDTHTTVPTGNPIQTVKTCKFPTQTVPNSRPLSQNVSPIVCPHETVQTCALAPGGVLPSASFRHSVPPYASPPQAARLCRNTGVSVYPPQTPYSTQDRWERREFMLPPPPPPPPPYTPRKESSSNPGQPGKSPCPKGGSGGPPKDRLENGIATPVQGTGSQQCRGDTPPPVPPKSKARATVRPTCLGPRKAICSTEPQSCSNQPPSSANSGSQPASGQAEGQSDTLRQVQELLGGLVSGARCKLDLAKTKEKLLGPHGPLYDIGTLQSQLHSLEGVLETSQNTIKVLLDVIQDLEKKEAERDGRHSYRTGQDIENCGTCRDCACIIYSVEHDFRLQEGQVTRAWRVPEHQEAEQSSPQITFPPRPPEPSQAVQSVKKSRRKCFWFL